MMSALSQSSTRADPRPESHLLAARRQKAQLRELKERLAPSAEIRWLRQNDDRSDGMRAHGCASAYDAVLAGRDQSDPAFGRWSANRALDFRDFNYLFRHRNHFLPPYPTLLEIIAAKVTHWTNGCQPGYFHKLENNLRWTRHITPILFSECSSAEKLVRCGIWTHAGNSRRCHKSDLCPLCLWNDQLKVLVAAFGAGSGAFFQAPAWWFITCGITTNPRNAKARSGDLGDEDFAPVPQDRRYDPFPICLGRADDDPDLAWLGYDDGRTVGLIIQEALDALYQASELDGYRHKLEGAFQLDPGGANRVNLHGHAVANGRETNGDYLAVRLFESLAEGLAHHRCHLNRTYYPDVKVLRINSPDRLKGALTYCEKIVPVARIVDEAMARPQARGTDGAWNPAYLDALRTSLFQLLDEDIPGLFTGFRLDDHLHRLRRRKAVGNLTFTDRGTCLGDEPAWHRRVRRKRAADLRLKRQARRREQAALLVQGLWAAARPKPSQRRLRQPRRLARSLGARPARPLSPPATRPATPATPRPRRASPPPPAVAAPAGSSGSAG